MNNYAVELTCRMLDDVLRNIEFLEHMFDKHPEDKDAISAELVKLDRIYLSVAEHLPADNVEFKDIPDYNPAWTLRDAVKFHKEERNTIAAIVAQAPVDPSIG